jgi:predicted RNA methylase
MAHAISEEVADVLHRSTVDGTILRLPGDQLPRPLYEATNKALTMLGGKWDRRKGGHVFPFDPAEKIAAALGDGKVVSRQQKLQLFETPPALAERLCEAIQIGPCDICLEPSAGRGRITSAMRARHPFSVEAVEIDPDNAATLEIDGDVSVGRLAVGDFMSWVVRDEAYRPNKIAMNPPFTRNQDIRHVRRAFDILRPGGRLAAIVSEHGFTGQERECVEWRDWLAEHRATIEVVPAGAFKESGTGVATRIIVLWKRA